MYYRLKYGKYYLVKIAILVLVAVAGELIIWWALVREESVEWITGQLVHNPSVYAITQLDDGRTIIGNVLDGFEIILPEGWQAKELRSPNFYFNENGNLLCEIKSKVERRGEDVNVPLLLKEQEGFVRVSAGLTPAVKKEQTTKAGDFIYELQIPLAQSIIRYTMSSGGADRSKCRPYFEQIRKSFLYY
ncbi:MAG: hypothetical protein PHQ42_00585 [Patescibacteria group bacterium]|nr:hypothetical protein [Patescibacteria group bacterium]